jgi:hypothetical protein
MWHLSYWFGASKQTNLDKIKWSVFGSLHCFYIELIPMFLVSCVNYAWNNFDDMEYRFQQWHWLFSIWLIWTKAWDFHTKVKCHANINHGHFLPTCGRCQAPMFKGGVKTNIFMLMFWKTWGEQGFGIVYLHY